jgi:DNA-binding CsgD family transcriptional regulator/PAS domain-containing protein
VREVEASSVINSKAVHDPADAPAEPAKDLYGVVQATARAASLRDLVAMRRAVRTSEFPLYLVTLADSGVVEVSDAALQLGRWSREEVLGLTLRDLAARPEHLSSSFELLANGGLEACTRRSAIRRADGSSTPVLVHYCPESRAAPRELAVGGVLGTAGAEGEDLPVAPDTRRRVAELEEHLRRIAEEVTLSGLAPWRGGMPSVDAVPELGTLTGREREIVARLLVGDRVQVIARELFLSESTVRNHLTAVFRKFDVRSQAALLSRLRDTAPP